MFARFFREDDGLLDPTYHRFLRPELVAKLEGTLREDLNFFRIAAASGYNDAAAALYELGDRHALLADAELMGHVVRRDGLKLERASEKLRDTDAIVASAVGQNGAALRFASERLRGTKSIVQIAVLQNWKARELASFEMQVDPEIKAAARENSGRRFCDLADRQNRAAVAIPPGV